MSSSVDRDLKGLRSVPSNVKIRLSFFNTTHSYVRILWINFNGQKQEYTTLAPKEIGVVHTYDKHYWIAEDLALHHRVLSNHCRVFRPIEHEYINYYIAEGEASSRTFMVMVTSNGPPSLQYLALKNATKFLKGPDDKRIRELPRVLQEDIIENYKKQGKFSKKKKK